MLTESTFTPIRLNPRGAWKWGNRVFENSLHNRHCPVKAWQRKL